MKGTPLSATTALHAPTDTRRDPDASFRATEPADEQKVMA